MYTGSRIRLIFGRANKAIEQLDKRSIAQTGLNTTDFMILEALLHKGAMPISKIADKVLLTSGSMSTAANRLEKRELVQRVRDPADGRSYYLHLTKAGKQIITAAYSSHCKMLERMIEGFNQNELSELASLLKKIGLQAEQITDEPNTTTR